MANISITRNPTKTIYFSEEIFNSSGLIVTFHDDNEINTQITNYTLNIPEIINNGAVNITKTVIVIYQNMMASFSITVRPILVGSINVSHIYPPYIYDPENSEDPDSPTIPIRNYYFSEEVFDSSGLNVKANYNNGTFKSVTGYSFNRPDMINNGVNDVARQITVTYTEKGITVTNTFSIIIKPILLEYIEVIGNYNDFSSKEITNYNLSNPNMNNAGTQTIIVTYVEKGITKTITFLITIKAIVLESIYITKQPNKVNYFVGDIFSLAGIEVTGYNNNDTSFIITNYSQTIPNMNNVGTQAITIIYNGKNTRFNINVDTIPKPLDVNAEFWQHIRFQMPDDNLTLNLKWIERMYLIDFIYKERLINIATLRDTNKVYDINHFNGSQSSLQQFRLPHHTYSKVITKYSPCPPNKPIQNEVTLNLKLIDETYFKIENNTSYCKFANDYKMMPYKEHNNSIVTINEENKTIKVIMPKYSVKIFLNIVMKWDRPFLKNVFGEGAFFITPDQSDGSNVMTRFEIWIGAGRGRKGGNESSHRGGG